MHGDQLGKLVCPGDGFREPIDPTGPLAEAKHRIAEFGGWVKFQALLMCLDEIARKHGTTLDVVALRYFVNKGVHPIVTVPWGPKCAEKFPNLTMVNKEFLEPGDLAAISSAFLSK